MKILSFHLLLIASLVCAAAMPPSHTIVTAAEKSLQAVSPQYVQALISAMQTYYETRDETVQKTIINTYFAPEADYKGTRVPVFEDPLMVVYGREKIRLQFKSLIKFFSVIRFEPIPYTIPGMTVQSVTGSPEPAPMFKLDEPGHFGEGTVDVSFKSNQYYTMGKRQINLTSVRTTLTLQRESGKILMHRDVWEGDQPQGEGRFYTRFGKPVVGIVTSAFFKLIGW